MRNKLISRLTLASMIGVGVVALAFACDNTMPTPTPTPMPDLSKIPDDLAQPVYNAPTVTAVSPTSGVNNATTMITITGTDFRAGAQVTVGGQMCTGVVVVSPTSITCTAPANAVMCGAKDIVVTHPDDSKSGTGTGLFTYRTMALGYAGAPTNYTTGNFPRRVVAADMNRDGKGDLLLTDTTKGAISVVLGNGDGTFRTPLSVAAGRTPQAVASADLNGDGNPDLLAADQAGAELYAYLGSGDGTVGAPQRLLTDKGGAPLWISTGDLNKDGRMDAVVANLSTANISLFLGKGDGTFFPAVQIPTVASPCDVEVADLDQDGNLDLGVNGEGADKAVAVHLGDGKGGFLPIAKYPFKDGSGQGLDLADLNQDGWPELIAASAFSAPARVFLGAGNGAFLPEQLFAGVGGNPFNVRSVDLNRDGKRDLVLSEASNRNISVLINTTP